MAGVIVPRDKMGGEDKETWDTVAKPDVSGSAGGMMSLLSESELSDAGGNGPGGTTGTAVDDRGVGHKGLFAQGDVLTAVTAESLQGSLG
jgi:hypothetical protein